MIRFWQREHPRPTKGPDVSATALQVVVTGVSGSGKTTVARLLAEAVGARLAEADEFHSRANIDKMRAGHPLDDQDRAPWLADIASWLGARARAGETAVITCSALKRAYRDVLRTAGPGVRFVHLAGPQQVVADRLGGRSGHFMPPELLDSQYADLEPLGEDEVGTTLDLTLDATTLTAQACAALGLRP
jgi:gluconokinase